MMKNISAIAYIVIIILLLTSTGSKDIPKNTFVQINPTALNIMINAFDQVLVYFHNETDQDNLKTFLDKYQKELLKINEKYPNDHSIFSLINTTSDFKADLNLDKFQSKLGFKLFNGFDHFEYDQKQSFLSFYQKKIHPKLQLSYQSDLHKAFEGKEKYYLIFPFSNNEELNKFNSIYEKMFKHIQEFNIECFAVPSPNALSIVLLYQNTAKINQYSLFNRTIQQSASQIIQSINIDTLPTLIELSEENFGRVFGGSVQDQILFIKQKQNQSILQSLKEFENAANYNRYESLAYQRVLFVTLSQDFFKQNFNEDISNLHQNLTNSFTIIFTQTNYGRFQLKKYIFDLSKDQIKSQDIIKFVENIRLKKQDPHYKSQLTPSQQQNNKVLRKIVGNSFISEVFQKPEQSIIILFYDSKDQNSYLQIKRDIQEFAKRYKEEIKDKLVLAQFNLAKNQHKLLYIKQAPQLLLFDKSNKKQSKYFRQGEKITYEKLEEWIISEVSNINIQKKVLQL